MEASIDMQEAIARLETIAVHLNVASRSVLSMDEAAVYLSMSKDTLYKYTAAHTIPHYRRGNAIYFKKSELDEWLLYEKVPTEKELKKKVYIR